MNAVNQAPIKISVEDLAEEPYASILCYPRAEPAEAKERILELRALGVTDAEFEDRGFTGGLPVLGKGYEGVVIVAYMNGERVALKMRRTDGGRENFFHEGEMLQKANAVSVGPRFMAVSKNFLASQLIGGGTLTQWMQNSRNRTKFRKVLKNILEQCFRLDEAGIDHGEISKAHKHILMDTDGKPYIIDFETSSIARDPNNVSSVCQYLFLGNSVVSKTICEVMGGIDREEIVKAVKCHKKERTRESFDALLRAINV